MWSRAHPVRRLSKSHVLNGPLEVRELYARVVAVQKDRRASSVGSGPSRSTARGEATRRGGARAVSAAAAQLRARRAERRAEVAPLQRIGESANAFATPTSGDHARRLSVAIRAHASSASGVPIDNPAREIELTPGTYDA
jgi:hypothetical protein